MKNFLKNTASNTLGVFFGLMLLWMVLEIYHAHSEDAKILGSNTGQQPKN